MSDALLYRAREFPLADIEGLSRRALEQHLELYRGHVEEVNRLLNPSEAGSPEPSRAREPASKGPWRPPPSSRFAFEYNGMVLHELFFEALTGALGTFPLPDGAFHSAVARAFGSLDAWKSDIRRLAHSRGAGWVACMRARAGNRIFNCWIGEHSIDLPAATDPVLVIDLWEHAWIADYRPEQRDDYLDTVLTQIDWGVIERRCA